MRLKPLGSDEKYPFEFKVDVKNVAENKIAFQVKVPYKLIWLEEEGDQLQATLALNLEIYDSSEEKVWETIKDYPINLTEKELGEIIVEDYTIDLQVELAKGDYTYSIELKNLADENNAYKKGKFTV
jgi:hypothetical protein